MWITVIRHKHRAQITVCKTRDMNVNPEKQSYERDKIMGALVVSVK